MLPDINGIIHTIFYNLIAQSPVMKNADIYILLCLQ